MNQKKRSKVLETIPLKVFDYNNNTIKKEKNYEKLLYLLVLLVGLNSNAQTIETLVPQKIEADSMTGNEGGTAWTGEHIYFYETVKEEVSIVLTKPEHIFVSGGQPKLGYYNKNDSLIGMANIFLAMPMEDGTRMIIGASFSKDTIPYGEYSDDKYYEKKAWRVKPVDVLRWLKETDGYARIVTTTYGNHLFDIRFRLKREE